MIHISPTIAASLVMLGLLWENVHLIQDEVEYLLASSSDLWCDGLCWNASIMLLNFS